MTVTEYTISRAQSLIKLNIPEIEQPFGIEFLWFAVIDSDEKDIYPDIHSHSFYEVHFVFSGKVSYECNGKNITLSRKQAILLSPDTPHKFIKENNNFLKLSITFKLKNGNGQKPLFPDTGYKVFDFCDGVTENVNFILKQSEVNDFFTPALISGRILEIVYSVCKATEIEIPQNYKKSTDSRLSTAKQYIENNKHRLISCEDVAKECCLSRKQLGRIFKKYTDKTLYEYLIDSRAKYAKKLVLQNECNIKEIGYMLGFESESSFVSFFKRHFGTSPSAYRTQNQPDKSTNHLEIQ